MPESFVIHLPHYLDDKGNLPDGLPGPAVAIALFCGAVVAWVSSGGGDLTNVVCRRTRARPPCRAEVYARRAPGDRIEWRCPGCGEEGRRMGIRRGTIGGWRTFKTSSPTLLRSWLYRSKNGHRYYSSTSRRS